MATELPHHLYGSFRRYKEDTEWCIEWLLDSAKACGYDTSKYDSQEVDEDGRCKYHLKTVDISNLAHSVSTEWPKLQISQAFMRKLEYAVHSRSRCADWFDKCDDLAIQEQTATHRHFILVLQGVHDVLKPLADQQTTINVQRQQSEDTTAPHQASLEEEEHELTKQLKEVVLTEDTETTDAGTMEQEVKVLKKHTTLNITVEGQTEHDVQSIHSAIHCLLIDLHQIRIAMKKIWCDYRDDKCALSVASVLATVAMSLEVQLQQETLPKRAQSMDYRSLVEPYYDGNTDFQPKMDTIQLPDDTTVGAMEFVLYNGWALAETFLYELRMQMVVKAVDNQAKKREKRQQKRAAKSPASNEGDVAATNRIDPDDLPQLNRDAMRVSRSTLAAIQQAYGVSLDYRLGKKVYSFREDAILCHFRKVLPDTETTAYLNRIRRPIVFRRLQHLRGCWVREGLQCS